MSRTSELKERVRRARAAEAADVKPEPYFVFYCDACGIQSPFNGRGIVPTSMSCSLCAGVCRREWRRPQNYDPRQGRNR
jgi:hypothetical protein